MKIYVLTLFPEYFESPFATSILKRAQNKGAAQLHVIALRDFATDVHKTTDDRPFGGGPGMVMKVEPIDRALQHVKLQIKTDEKLLVLLTSAKGNPYTQAMARDLVTYDAVIIICGHYEGVDERVALSLVDREVRVGDFVMTGGEPAAAAIVDSLVRLLPGVLGNEYSTVGESHDEPGMLGYPQYTRPQEFKGMTVPEVLLSGDHSSIEKWREAQRTPKKV